VRAARRRAAIVAAGRAIAPVSAAAAAAASIAVCIALSAGCERAPREPFPDEEELPAPAAGFELPQAFSLRFEQVEGNGFSREGWDLEILQVGGDVRVRGGVRTAGSYVPVFRPMDPAEFAEIWQWLSAFPLDRFRVTEDTAAAAPGWRKSLRYDAVLGPDRRELSESEWTRPPVDAPWVQAIEDRLHLMVLDLAGRELDKAEQAAVVDTAGVVQRALEAIGEEAPPGGSP
jgi:hypothetical protein